MTARFIVRLVDAEGSLLAWAEVMAESKPQGRPKSTPFQATQATPFVIERDGVASELVIHWADLDVVRATSIMNPTAVHVGQLVNFNWIEPVWMVKGSEKPIELVPVTVRGRVHLNPPAGGIGVVSLQ